MRFAPLQEGAKNYTLRISLQGSGGRAGKGEESGMERGEVSNGRAAGGFRAAVFAPRLTSRRHEAVASSAGGLAPLMTSQSVNAGSPKKVG